MLFFALFSFPIIANAQGQANNWLFGAGPTLHMNFTSSGNSYVHFPNLFNNGGSASVSDKAGNLLFHSDGLTIRDRSLQPMLGLNNSGQLDYSNTSGPFYSSVGVIAVPYPLHDSLYYLFYIEKTFFNNRIPKLRCALINTKRNNGLGEVVMRDSLMLNGDSIQVKLTATKHCNKKDVWLIGHKGGSDKFFAFLITENGISPNPILSIGNFKTGVFSNDGYMKLSPAGDKLAISYFDNSFTGELGNIELADFNNQTGVVSNSKTLLTNPTWAESNIGQSTGNLGLEFSSSGKFLYAATMVQAYWANNLQAVGALWQYDVSSNNQTTIQNSRTFLDSTAFVGTALQMAVNGKIYFNQTHRLSTIDNPEGVGTLCNFNRNSVSVPDENTYFFAGTDLPQYLQSSLQYLIQSSGNCLSQTMSFKLHNLVGVTGIEWDFGDLLSGINNTSSSLTPTHTFTSSGVYTVKAIVQNSTGCVADTVIKVVHAGTMNVRLGNDTYFCTGDSVVLSTSIPNATYFWSNNTYDSIAVIKQPGTYSVKVILGECIGYDTIIISEKLLPQFTLGGNIVECNNIPVTLSPNPPYTSFNYLWSNNSIAQNITVLSQGNYWLTITDNFGCKQFDTINVQFKQLPTNNLGADTTVCDNAPIQLNAKVNGATSYTWSTGEGTPKITATIPNWYWCDVAFDGCVYRDSIQISNKPYPIVSLGADKTLCEDETITLDATNTNSIYQWQDNTVNPTYTVTKGGMYFVTVNKQSCIAKDTINISYNLKPKFTLGADRQLCVGTSILLDPKITDVSYVWQDGSINKTYLATKEGRYLLTATNFCGSTTDEINLTKGVCELYVPNAFTPNGDRWNNEFKASYGDNVIEFKLEIFNRYGQLLFTTKDKNKGWDGTVNGTKQEQGTYTWVIQYRIKQTVQPNVLQGTVMLLR